MLPLLTLTGMDSFLSIILWQVSCSKIDQLLINCWARVYFWGLIHGNLQYFRIQIVWMNFNHNYLFHCLYPGQNKWIFLFFLCLGSFLLILLLFIFSAFLILVGTLVIIIHFSLYDRTVGYDASLLDEVVTSWIPLKIITIAISVSSLCNILSKCDSVHYWNGCPCITVILIIKKIIGLNHIFQVAVVALGVIILHLFNDSDVPLIDTLTDKRTCQVLLIGCCWPVSLFSGPIISFLDPRQFFFSDMSAMDQSWGCP